MSGICALINFGEGKAEISLLARMMAAGAHRGPDGSHAVTAGSAALGHLALDVSEPVGPRQPLLHDGLCLSADVRLDNREELIALLRGRGHNEAGPQSSDAELLLASYQCWSEKCPEHLLGDFAFVLWDARLQRLFCARDPLGIKPLCHARVGSWLYVASEAQQILAHPGAPPDLDEISLGRHLMGWTEPLDRTFFRSIHPVPPATSMVFGKEGQTARTFWSFQEKPDSSRREDDAAACLLDVLREAVSTRLRSRGPAVGVSLSGGLDSSSVAALARQTLAPDRALVGLTYTFDRLVECDEREHVRALAEKLPIERVSIDAERYWFLGDSAAFTPDPDSPFLGWESSYRAMLAALADRGGRVLLTGHGADDFLGGSLSVYADRFWTGDLGALSETVRLAPERSLSLARALIRYLLRPVVPSRRVFGKGPTIPRWITPAFSQSAGLPDLLRAPGWRRPGRLADDEVRERILEERGFLRTAQWHDRRASPFGIEPRHPFLDRRLLELVLALPSRLLFRIGSRKPLLRQAMRGLLPETLLARRDKTRFGRFLDLSFRDRAAAKIQSLLEEPLSADLGMLDAAQLRAAYQAYRTGQGNESAHLLWNAVTLELWVRHLHLRHSHHSPPIVPAPPTLACGVFGGERIAS